MRIVPLEEIAARALNNVVKGRSLKSYLEREYRRLGIPDRARPVLVGLVSNVARRWMVLSYLLEEERERPPKGFSKWLKLVIAYQAVFRKVPYEKLKVKAEKEWYEEMLKVEPEDLEREFGPRVFRSVPKWAWREIAKVAEPIAFVDSLDFREHFWIRVRDPKVIKRLKELRLELEESELPDVFKAKGPMRVLITTKLHPKKVIIMEKASAWIAHLTEGKVLDLTSAPGGKALHAQDLGRIVVANDIDPKRFAFREIERVAGDARRGPFRRAFDTVILDPDCTGIGRLHSPESRLWLAMTSKEKMAEYQRELIRASIKYLKKGGRLIYSTCTITYEENEGHEKLMNELGLRAVEVEVASPGFKRGWRRFLPNVHGTIGFTLTVHEF
ncbi:hypothetical protein IPA_02585 [Ignicoccus pacificus DSM 13166]|uniref:SAM-dependent MTase RsmB/NOP-type domain-containing protein n=1 Tax=Ignicoccus pacificus DSM 13166 TaxID=940294 RepID=A0A977KAR1_9CREN|nr:hypothetical protein IPA_02585 [Ignicoccus pacificus DSM 13166]